jgi:hypothetical protein
MAEIKEFKVSDPESYEEIGDLCIAFYNNKN